MAVPVPVSQGDKGVEGSDSEPNCCRKRTGRRWQLLSIMPTTPGHPTLRSGLGWCFLSKGTKLLFLFTDMEGYGSQLSFRTFRVSFFSSFSFFFFFLSCFLFPSPPLFLLFFLFSSLCLCQSLPLSVCLCLLLSLALSSLQMGKHSERWPRDWDKSLPAAGGGQNAGLGFRKPAFSAWLCH